MAPVDLAALADAVGAPSSEARAAAVARQRQLTKPAGALGRLEELSIWLAGAQGRCPPSPPANPRVVVFAGDHGVAHAGVSAYPPAVTAQMVANFLAGGAAANVLARQLGATVRVVDLAVDAEVGSAPAEMARHKVGRSSGRIDREDALTPEEAEQAFEAGLAIADEEVDSGADLLIPGDMGIGNTTPASALVAATFGAAAEEVVGRGTGVADDRLAHKTAVVARALRRAGDRVVDPVQRLAALGSADLAAGVGFLCAAARSGVPVLLDGIVPVAELSVAEDLAPGVLAWCAAGHRSTEPAQRLALDKLGLEPVLDLGLRLGEGTGALAAVPLLRSAALLLSDMALLTDLLP